MTTPSEEELMARLLSAWLEDLRHDREPRPSDLVERLPAEKSAEIMDLARWYKAVLYPTSGTAANVDTLAANIGKRVMSTRQTEAADVAESVRAASSFDEILRSAAAQLHIDLANLEEACGLAKMELLQVAAGTQPGHRLPIEAMVRVFRGLRLPTAAVDTLRRSSLEWAKSQAREAQVQLNRPSAAAAELESTRDLESYCAELRARLG